MQIIKPHSLKLGDTIGVFTPSSPAYIDSEERFLNGIKNLERLGFKTKLGTLTSQRSHEGYRSGTPQDRADELMNLIQDPNVHGIISTIGGNNSSSLIPYLDFDEIRRQRKPLSGFSDVTSLHAAILKFSGLSTFYGPAVMTSHGEWPDGSPECSQWFLDAVMQRHGAAPRRVNAPDQWSNHRRRWSTSDWKTIPREWQKNEGWHVLNPGKADAPILAMNLNTLVSAAGTKYWPDFSGKILLVEDMEAPHGRNERHFRHLSLCGVFDAIAGLIVGKPEVYDAASEPFTYDDLIKEVVGPRNYPIISNFDCGHTYPMITIPQLARVRFAASGSIMHELEIFDCD